ncbi:MAG: hypothetical protein QOG51_842 [Verrucomicrobiota bacterium]|jgi:hypothetical protein
MRSQVCLSIDPLAEISPAADGARVENSDEKTNPGEGSRASRAGIRLMIIIVIAIALVAVYANIQKARRDKIESVTIIPAATTTPSPAP